MPEPDRATKLSDQIAGQGLYLPPGPAGIWLPAIRGLKRRQCARARPEPPSLREARTAPAG
jgi:hypothetical protein